MKRGIWLSCMAITFAASVAYAADLKVLALIGDARNQEVPILKATTKLGNHNFTHEDVVIEGGKFDGNLRSANILWFPWNGPGHDGLYFMEGSEDAVKTWVRNGGAVWVSAFDDNFKDANGSQVGGWMPLDESPAIVQNTGDAEVELTADGQKSPLFTTPNAVDMNAPVLDDNFANVGGAWVVLATRKDNQQPAVAYLPYGKGVYLTACIDTRDAARATSAKPLMENALLFLGDWATSGTTAVEPHGRLTTTWSSLKTRTEGKRRNQVTITEDPT